MSAFAGRAVQGAYWVLAIVLLCVYCGARSYGELERHEAIALFTKSRVPNRAEELMPPDSARARSDAPHGADAAVQRGFVRD